MSNNRQVLPTEIMLARAMNATRMQGEGIPLYRVAEIIGDELDWAEAEALIGYLEKIADKKRSGDNKNK